MGRFFARFDASIVNPPTLAAFYFNPVRVGANSASGALIRDGLIASRSALSADIYDDLDAVNKDPSRGTYFPPDLLTTPGAPTFVSWSTAYTSSVAGIKTPVANVYGASPIDYSLRPTASITSTRTPGFVTASVPNDPVQASYTTYINATTAVSAAIAAFQTASTGATITPYRASSSVLSRTLHSLWNDPTMSFFGWDDFTPGGPVQQNPTNQGNGNCSGVSGNYTINPTLRVFYAKELENDFNPSGKLDLRINYYSNNAGAGNQFDDLLQFDLSGSGTSGIYRYIQYTTRPLSSNNLDNINYDIAVTASFFDATITTSEGPRRTVGKVNIVNCTCTSPGGACL